MADNDKVDEPVVEETPEVELDKPTEITGEIVENPIIEEVSDVEEDETAEDGKDAETEESPVTEDAEDQETESAPELEPEKDETGVYSPRTTEDPGDFQPKGDYGFEVTTADGRTIRINTPADGEAFAERLDSEENLLTATQFVQFTRKFAKMDSGIDREKSEYETQKSQFETQQAQEQVRNDQVIQWNNEINYLQGKGLIPEISGDKNADWLGNREDPAVKARLDIFQWMEKENNDRRSAGIPEVSSAVDAFRLMQADTQEQSAKEEQGREVTKRQAKGKMVSGNSSFTPSNEQNGSIVGEGGNLRDLVRDFNTT